jgi:YbbR domain-containing protein
MNKKNKWRKHSLKFISIIFSLTLWLYVVNSETIKVEKTVYIDYIMPDDLVWAKRPAQEITLILNGPRAFLRSILDREDRITIDLLRRNKKGGMSYDIPLQKAEFQLPLGIEVENIIPKKISVKLEKKASKIIPVKPVFTGQLTASLNMESWNISPREVEVYGPRSVIVSMKDVSTRAIDLDSLMIGEELMVELNIPNERVSVITGKDVMFRPNLKTNKPNLVLPKVPVRINGALGKVVPNTVSLKAFLPESLLKNSPRIEQQIEVWVEVPIGTKGKVEADVKYLLPTGSYLIDLKPRRVLVDTR